MTLMIFPDIAVITSSTAVIILQVNVISVITSECSLCNHK